MNLTRTFVTSLTLIALLLASTPMAHAAPVSEVVKDAYGNVPNPIEYCEPGFTYELCAFLGTGDARMLCNWVDAWIVSVDDCDSI